MKQLIFIIKIYFHLLYFIFFYIISLRIFIGTLEFRTTILQIVVISYFLQLMETILKSTRCSFAVGFSEEACLKLELKRGDLFGIAYVYDDEFDSYTSISFKNLLSISNK